MPLDPPSTVGPLIAAAVASIPVPAGTPVTIEQLGAIWTAAYTVIYEQLTTKASVAAGSFTSPTGAVTGLGGPLE